MSVLFILCPIIAIGAIVDAIAGGGGLITLTAYVAVGLPPQVALGNNKFASASGTAIACYRYIRNDQVDWKVGSIAMLTSLAGSAVGSYMATIYADTYLHYLLIFLVPAIAVFIMVKPDFGQAKPMEARLAIPFSAVMGLAIGLYDGFFGPGTGMFLTIIFTSVIGLDLLRACGTARVVNLASNIAAVATFIRFGSINYAIAIPCAVSAIIGGYIGSGLAIRGGVKVVKPVMLFVLSLLLLKVVASTFGLF
ncbi:TSUP family transporter [Sphaerochaeta sp. PS]|uniref:TSUP family transporter n=1 Tax=Sphaerochaeta sp. PS TaxID=3076336 RepID=UPI0028A30A71|nr:TSUP family transporter [Sphaerochaeta sp. PS]MDT4762924.1 TSUP family transporter [Sphaerochaeta sp. PS]